jgi:hypothetical protein
MANYFILSSLIFFASDIRGNRSKQHGNERAVAKDSTKHKYCFVACVVDGLGACCEGVLEGNETELLQ